MASSPNILIYRLGSLGDTVVALPCFHLIRKAYPRSKITILTNHPVAGKAAPAMAILENSGLCDEAIAYPVGTRSVSALSKIRETIRQMQPEALFNLAAGRGFLRSVRDYAFFRACGVKNIIGTPFAPRDCRVHSTEDGEFEPESQRLASRLASIGAINLADRRCWDLGLTQTEKKQAAGLLPGNRKSLLAVSVGTKVTAKDWGAENWKRLLALLAEKTPGSRLILLGAADESERSERLGQNWPGGYLVLCGKIAPRISAAVLEQCRLFIGHDSGPMHLAAAVGTPTLGLFAWFNPPGQWYPGHKSWNFIRTLYPPLPDGRWNPALQMRQGESDGIRLLRPEAVLKSAMELWDLDSNSAVPASSPLPARSPA